MLYSKPKEVAMKKITRFFGIKLIGACLVANFYCLLSQEAISRELRDDPIPSSKTTEARRDQKADSSNPTNEPLPPKSSPEPFVTTSRKIETDKVTSFFVRANDSKRIQLSMLVAYKAEFTQAVRELVGHKVTPLVFSVSTLPNRIVYFDPSQLCFEQGGRCWRPEAMGGQLDVLSLEEGGRFGGKLTDGELHQGVIFLPEWFDPATPITLRYGDFHYLARFVAAEE
jgi:hypothetical protein